MSNHVTDDDLILHFYGEANTEAPRIDGHLAECADCRENWNALQQTLKMVDSCEVPEAPEGFERVMWARIQPSLPSPKSAKAYWWSPRVWAPIAGLAAVITVAFVSGRLFSPAGSAGPSHDRQSNDA